MKHIQQLLTQNNLTLLSSDVNAYVQRQSHKELFSELQPIKQVELISGVLSVYYGVNLSNVTEVLIEAITHSLNTKYKHLSVFDLKHSFNRKEIVKRQGVGMTLGEFVEPIDEYIKSINTINARLQAERDRAIREENERQQSLLDYQREQRQMLQLFEHLKRQGVKQWSGTSSQAAMISKIVSEGVVSLDEKREIYRSVVEEMNKKQAIIDPRNNPYAEMLQDVNLANYEVKWKCAQKVVERCLNC